MAVNDQLYDRFVSHDVNLQRLQAHQRQLILSELRAIEARIIKKLQSQTGETFTKARQTALLKFVQRTIKTGYQEIYRTHRKEAEGMARLEVERAPTLVNTAIKTDLLTVGAPEAVIQSLLKDTSVLGAPLRRIWSQEASTTTQAFMSAMRQGILAGDTTEQMIRRVRGTKAANYKDGILDPARRRVEMRVRTSAQSILNDARMQTFRQNSEVISGVQAQVTLDDRTSDICMARSGAAWDLDGNPFPGSDTTEAFPGAPPWHPNAVLNGTTFMSYGHLDEMVGADYHGPAILVKTAQGKNVTVGPNHPILTQRGMICASQLTEDDYLIYDRRVEEAFPVQHPHFQQVPRVEDVFQSFGPQELRARRAITRYDFHGDGMWCQGEVQIIEPANGLLLVWDSGGIEQFRKTGFPRADMRQRMLSRDGAGSLGRDGISLPSSRGMRRCLSVSHFLPLKIQSIHYVEWVGQAFDATTESSCYNCNGFVVSNCRSTLVPLLKSWEELTGQTGLDAEIQKELRDVPRGTQSSMDGQVAESLTYEQWLKTKDDDFQREVLGPGKYRLWKTGKIGLKDLIDQRGHPLTLAQLKNLPPGDDSTGGLPVPPASPVVPPSAPLQPATVDDFFLAREEEHPYNSFMSPLSKDELQDKQLHLSVDGKVGYLLDSQGDFGNLFNHGGVKGQGQVAIVQAIEQGARTLDAFDGVLPELYAQYGYAVTGRMKFNDAFAPPNWNYARDGRPDVVFMAYQGGARESIKNRVGKFPAYIPQSGRYYTDYDQAKHDAQRAALARTDDRGARRRGSRESVAESASAARLRQKPLAAPTADFPPHRPDGIDTLTRFLVKGEQFTPERTLLHKAIEFNTFQSASAVKRPVAYVLGGGPASGKDTLRDLGLLRLPTNQAYIDPDVIKSKLPEYRDLVASGDLQAAAFVHEESSLLSKSFLSLAGKNSLNVTLNGTGDGSLDGLMDKVALMRASGQRVIAHYVTVPTDVAVSRAYARAQGTGRAVPEDRIRETHRNVSAVFPKAIERGLFDEFTLWDNTGARPVIIAKGHRNRLTILDQSKWDAFVRKAKE